MTNVTDFFNADVLQQVSNNLHGFEVVQTTQKPFKHAINYCETEIVYNHFEPLFRILYQSRT